jgi:hypothetical protein
MKPFFSKKLAFALLKMGVFFICAGCEPKRPPGDFAFTFSDQLDEISSPRGEFTRNLGMRDSVVHLSFTADEMQSLYSSLIEFEFSKLPDKIHTSGACVVPSSTYYLTVKVNSKTKHVIFYDGCNLKGKDGEAFLAIRKTIMEIFQKKPAYKNMPASEVLFL